jgi:hypothetical protein
MAVVRKLTIAGMKGTFKLRFRDVANQDLSFEVVCGGQLSVSRSANGTTYVVESDTDHFRVFTTIVTPTDFPTLFYWDDASPTGYGWFALEGFNVVEFKPGGWPEGLTANDYASSTSLLDPRQAEAEKNASRAGCACCQA